MCKPAIICMHYLYAFYGALYPSLTNSSSLSFQFQFIWSSSMRLPPTTHHLTFLLFFIISKKHIYYFKKYKRYSISYTIIIKQSLKYLYTNEHSDIKRIWTPLWKWTPIIPPTKLLLYSLPFFVSVLPFSGVFNGLIVLEFFFKCFFSIMENIFWTRIYFLTC